MRSCGRYAFAEVIAEEIAVPVRVPSPVTVWLGIAAFTVTGITATFPAVADPLFALLCSGADRSSIPGKSRMVRRDQPLMNGKIQKLLFIKTENERERIEALKFYCGYLNSRKAEEWTKDLPEDVKKSITDYVEATLLAADHDCLYLYEQGAKDCVELLKKLGVL